MEQAIQRLDTRPSLASPPVAAEPIPADVAEALVPVRAAVREFLVWVASRPRTYAETMAAWRSSCPRFTIWEDALEAGLVELRHDGCQGMDAVAVVLTERGRRSIAVS